MTLRLTVIFCCAIIAPCLAQNNPAQPNGEHYLIHANVNLVMVDASVSNRRGGYMSGLKKEDFQIRDNGRVREITRFSSAATEPASIALVVDFSGSITPKRPAMVQAARTFMRVLRPDDELMVILFNDEPGVSLAPSFVKDIQIPKLEQIFLEGRPDGRTSLYDALALALEELKSARRERRVIVLISDGGDNDSETQWDELQTKLHSSNAVVYPIGVFSKEDPDKDQGVLEKMARMSGGLAVMDYDAKDLTQTCERIANDIRSRYQLGFPVSDEDSQGLRKLDVIARDEQGKKLRVKARTHYVLSEAP